MRDDVLVDSTSLVAEEARSLMYGLAAGALAGVPAAWRVLGGEGDLWVLLGALALPMAITAPVVLALRRARLPRVTPPGAPPHPGPLRTLAVTVALSIAPLAWLGVWLEQSTHHRPLGAVTFACAALCVFLGAAIVARRLSSTCSAAVVVACAAVPLALGTWFLGRGVVAGFASGSAWGDGLVLLGVTAAATWLLPVPRSPASAKGPRAAATARTGDETEADAAAERPETAAERRPSGSARSAAAARRLWRGALLGWAAVCLVGVTALWTRGPELDRAAPAFTWPAR